MSPSGASAAGDQIFIDRTATEVRNRSLGTVFNLLYVDNFSDVPRQSNGMLFDDSIVIFFFCTPSSLVQSAIRKSFFWKISLRKGKAEEKIIRYSRMYRIVFILQI